VCVSHMFAFSTSFNVQECRIYRFCKLFSERKIYYRFCRQVIQYKEVIETKEVIVEKIVTKEVEVHQCRQFIFTSGLAHHTCHILVSISDSHIDFMARIRADVLSF
jgi:hypothetical protein